MKTIINIAQLIALVSILAGCVPVLIGGAIYHDTKLKENCSQLNSDPDLLAKLEIPEFKSHYEKVCNPYNSQQTKCEPSMDNYPDCLYDTEDSEST